MQVLGIHRGGLLFGLLADRCVRHNDPIHLDWCLTSPHRTEQLVKQLGYLCRYQHSNQGAALARV
ncbi:hypothetical protein D3C72_2118090 [compost metagenome]